MRREETTIAVVLGGPSAEREVSLATGHAMADALEASGYDVRRVDLPSLDIEPIRAVAPDLVVIALHGAFGEDGRLQAALERAGLPYTGSGPMASRFAMDKELTKVALEQVGVPTATYRVFDAARGELVVRAFASRAGYPLVVKPVAEGSSVGVNIIDGPAEVAEKVADTLRHGGRAMVEPFIAGRELALSILDDRIFPLVEIRPASRFYDYDAKYKSNTTRYVVAPDLPADVQAACERWGRTTYDALGCEGLVRVDFLVCPSRGPLVIEANTIPGMTPTSLVPKAAAHIGWSFADLCDEIVLATQPRLRLPARGRGRNAA